MRSLKRSEGDRLAKWLEELMNSPFTKGTVTVQDETDREIQVSRYGRFFIYHWTDHPEKTVRINKIERIG